MPHDGRPQGRAAVCVVAPPVVLDRGAQGREGGTGCTAVDQGKKVIQFLCRFGALRLARYSRKWLGRPLLGDGGGRDLPRAVGQAEHCTGDTKAVSDTFDHVDMCQAASPRHDLADSARRHAAQCRDPRRIDPGLDLDQPEDAGEALSVSLG